ncbi:MAG: Mur ligase domain-containing protein [Patescibacteria group bacterium]
MAFSIPKHIHFIGIGGIGMSALARFYHARGAAISGSDIAPSDITRDLLEIGAVITTGDHRAAHIPSDTDLVIATAAAVRDNPELTEARRRKIPVKSYAATLGPITRHFRTVTVSGAHGKSTTTALIALILEAGYCDPTVIIGTKLTEFGGSNFRRGRSQWLVLEADEYNRSFLRYTSHIAVVTNIDAEHLDTYKNVEAVERAFEKFLGRVRPDGRIVANRDDERVRRVAGRFRDKVVWYSLGDPDVDRVRRTLAIPGAHNVSNALAARRVGQLLGVPEAQILYTLARFRGAWRRFEFMGIAGGAFVISDYAHHPAEIRATIDAARERFPLRRIWCVFQPHQGERLRLLWNEFLTAFDCADTIVLLPVYEVAGREKKRNPGKGRMTSENLVRELVDRGKNAHYQESFAGAKEFITENTRKGDVLLIAGAGTIHGLAEDLVASSPEI